MVKEYTTKKILLQLPDGTFAIPYTEEISTWGNITGSLTEQEDLQVALNSKQNTLTAGNNITIENGVISANSSSGSGVIIREW